ncbi:MAG: hypothetical protein ACKO43_06100 [Alphaproteobacteria bacterium]
MRKVLCAAVLSVFMTDASAMAQSWEYNSYNPYNDPAESIRKRVESQYGFQPYNSYNYQMQRQTDIMEQQLKLQKRQMQNEERERIRDRLLYR